VREAGVSGGVGAARRALEAALGDAPPAWYDEPMLGRVVRSARGLIVHSRHARDAARRAGPGGPVEVIHHGVAAPVELPEPEGPFTIGVFGGLTPEKRWRSVVRAFRGLADARLLLVGEPAPGLLLGDPPAGVRLIGRVDLDEMERLIGRCHVCVQLRWPTAGEASGAVLRALRLGRPTIVSDCGWFAELPPDASPYGPDPRRSAGYALDRARKELGFEPSALEDALAETLAWYRVAHPSHPGYANRAAELRMLTP